MKTIIRNSNNFETGRTPAREFPFRSEFDNIMQFVDGIVLPHWHEDFEMITVYEGELLYRGEHQEYLLHPGEAVFINVKKLHSLHQADSSYCNYLVTNFSPDLLASRQDSILFQKYLYPFVWGNRSFEEIFFSLDCPWQKKLIKLLSSLHESKTQTDGYELTVQSTIFFFWEILYKNFLNKQLVRSGSSQQTQAIYQAIHYIEEHYAEKIYLAEIAHYCGLSNTECNRVFQRQVNCSPMEYVIRYRISCSLSLLADTDRTIIEIASAVGFDSHSYFSKVFRTYLKCTPKEYRNKFLYST